MDFYQNCPSFEGDLVRLSKTVPQDAAGLLACYSDPKAVPFFNGDNCNGDTFFYPTLERMREAVVFWEASYARREFIRWTVREKTEGKILGSIELFRREAEDALGGTALLRIDLQSAYETPDYLADLLRVVESFAYDAFDTDRIATRTFDKDTLRAAVLRENGYQASSSPLIGHDGAAHWDYAVKDQARDVKGE